MKIFDLLKTLYETLKNMWGSLSDEEKMKMALAIAKAFEKILRAFYKEHQKSKNNQQDSNQEKANA